MITIIIAIRKDCGENIKGRMVNLSLLTLRSLTQQSVLLCAYKVKICGLTEVQSCDCILMLPENPNH